MFLKIIIILMFLFHLIQLIYNKFKFAKHCTDVKMLIGMGVVSKYDNKMGKELLKKAIPLFILIILNLLLNSIIIIGLFFTSLWPLGLCLLILTVKITFGKNEKHNVHDIKSNDYNIKFKDDKKKKTFFEWFAIIVQYVIFLLIFIGL